jgi:hypothetical protein
MGSLRDKKRKIITPAIAFRRTSIAKNEQMPVDKLDPLDPKIYNTYQSQYTRENRYDKLSATRGITPKKEMYAVAVPDYVTLSYDFILWTSFTDQMNQIVEKIHWSEGSYWGEEGKFKFRAVIDSFDDASEYEGQRRNIKTTFSVSLYGYLLPKSFSNLSTTQKWITPKQIIIVDESDVSILPVGGMVAGKSIRVVTHVGGAGGGAASTGAAEIQILDESGQLTGAATAIDFTGKGVTATTTGTRVTVNIPESVGSLFEKDADGDMMPIAGSDSAKVNYELDDDGDIMPL